MNWETVVNDATGIHSTEPFRTRDAAEQFAASRSFWRRGVYILVRRSGEQRWISAYKNGWLADTQDGRSFRPKEDPNTYSLKLPERVQVPR